MPMSKSHVTIKRCSILVAELEELKHQILSSTHRWSDCLSLIERTLIFRDTVRNINENEEKMNGKQSEKEEKISKVTCSMNNLFEETIRYVEKMIHPERQSFQGMLDAVFRNDCSTEFAKVNEKIIKLADDVDVSYEVDREQRKNEDLKVRVTFLFVCPSHPFFSFFFSLLFSLGFKKFL
jgi:hypothetical protein